MVRSLGYKMLKDPLQKRSTIGTLHGRREVGECPERPQRMPIPAQLLEFSYRLFTVKWALLKSLLKIYLMMMFFGVALTTWAITAERKQGLVNRNIVSGVRTLEVLFSYILAEFVLMCGQAFILVFFSFVVYKFQCVGNVMLAITLIFIQGLNGILLGLVISSSCDREETTSYLAIGSLVPLLIFCGTNHLASRRDGNASANHQPDFTADDARQRPQSHHGPRVELLPLRDLRRIHHDVRVDNTVRRGRRHHIQIQETVKLDRQTPGVPTVLFSHGVVRPKEARACSKEADRNKRVVTTLQLITYEDLFNER
ncbi:hypothetical protein PR048_014767 [Dryococelus australis]|uniref:ABC-2 type transporter transmembrane domain-containing protein n=1 Tax=Dryococelus australis TaxID=614101 RepID=A0ABQ9HF35_9NEOP|nr:hypothetical protein PR048_014767 [Dryococelus australis]